MKDPVNWPESLHKFINSSFQKSNALGLSDEQKKVFQNQLKRLINLAVTKNELLNNDWSKQIVPVLQGWDTDFIELNCDLIKRKKLGPYAEKSVPKKSGPSAGPPAKKIKVNSPKSILASDDKLAKRSQRFQKELNFNPIAEPPSTPSDVNQPLIGTCTKLEKNYFRLTSEPRPEQVRPLPVLKKTLQFLLDKQLSQGVDYNYMCDQLKSIRQDLTVQHVKNWFTVVIYEYHCKTAIEFADLGEYNQSLSQLFGLYDLFLQHKLPRSPQHDELHNFREFAAYRILYFIITDNRTSLVGFKLELLTKFSSLWIESQDPFLTLALEMMDCWLTNNFYSLFQAIARLESMAARPCLQVKQYCMEREKGGYYHFLSLNQNSWFWFKRMVEMSVSKMRVKALHAIVNSYRKIGVDFLKRQLLYKEASFTNFISDIKPTLTDDGKSIDCVKARPLVLEQLTKLKRVDIKGQI